LRTFLGITSLNKATQIYKYTYIYIYIYIRLKIAELSNSTRIEKLRGQENYEIWKLRIQAILVEKELETAITDARATPKKDAKALAVIQLNLQDGPLLQIQNLSSAYSAWQKLESLYATKGFSSDYLICKELFSTKLERFSSMEQYLNKVQQLTDSLNAKEIPIPKQVVCAWILDNLTPSYHGFVSIVTQNYRNSTTNIDLDAMYANLIDESRRQESLEKNTPYLIKIIGLLKRLFLNIGS